MRELVAVGGNAVPQLCAELDLTTEDRMLRRLAFALRAIGDPPAIPALIRAIPRTLVPAVTREGSMGLIETTDRVTRTAELTGMAGSPPAGVGFHTGVRFNLQSIIP